MSGRGPADQRSADPCSADHRSPDRRDTRILFRDGWMLILFLVCFGAAACGLFWWSSPRGSAGWIRFAVSFALVLFAGGIAAPIVTRAVYRRR